MRSEKGFAPIVIIIIATLVIGAGVGGFLVLQKKKMSSSETATTPQFIQSDFIDLSKISSISKFRSGSGHDFSQGSGETCRSMKHYFNVWRTEEADRLVNQNKGIPPPPDGKTDIPIYSPVDGKIINIESEQVPIGQQIYIQPDLYPNFTVRLFHIYPLSDIKKGVKVKAGQKIGIIGQYQNTDIAITQGREKYISYFEVMPDNIFAKYQALGVKNRKELIISKEERDANPLECNGEWFVKNYDGDPNFENFVYLEDVTSPIEPTPSPVQSIQPPKPKMQPGVVPVITPSIAPASPQSLPKQTIKAEFKFARFPFDIKDIGSVAPIGEFSGITRQTAANSHHYGNMRHYIFSKKPGEYAYNVYVPADGEITGFRNDTGEFRFNFKINDKSFYYFDHIQSLSAEILEKLKPYFGSPQRITRAVEQVYPPIPIKAGFVLGQTGLKGIAWDWGVIDQNYCQDILYPEHYYQDRCPRSVYDFMNDEMKAQVALLAGYWFVSPSGTGFLQVKTVPVLGQYAHDIAGTLSGGWFKEYRGWQNAFFVPDPYEPNTFQIRLAIPELSVFGVWNRIALGTGNVNSDPKKVTPASGVVSYVLPLHKARDNNEYGVLLVRVNNDETITVETLSGATSAPAGFQFTDKAIILKR